MRDLEDITWEYLQAKPQRLLGYKIYPWDAAVIYLVPDLYLSYLHTPCQEILFQTVNPREEILDILFQNACYDVYWYWMISSGEVEMMQKNFPVLTDQEVWTLSYYEILGLSYMLWSHYQNTDRGGIEPPFRASETRVLPLDQRSILIIYKDSESILHEKIIWHYLIIQELEKLISCLLLQRSLLHLLKLFFYFFVFL